MAEAVVPDDGRVSGSGCGLSSFRDPTATDSRLIIIIIMYIYCALSNALSAHIIILT